MKAEIDVVEDSWHDKLSKLQNLPSFDADGYSKPDTRRFRSNETAACLSPNNVSDVGLYAVTHNEADRGKFKTPSLRNIALTAPYMHDGSLADLKQVLDFYIGAGNSHLNLDKEIHTLDFLTGQERRDLLEFLNSLTGEMPPNVGPDMQVLR